MTYDEIIDVVSRETGVPREMICMSEAERDRVVEARAMFMVLARARVKPTPKYLDIGEKIGHSENNAQAWWDRVMNRKGVLASRVADRIAAMMRRGVI